MVSRVSVAEAAPVVASSGAVLCRDSVKLRILEIEDLLSVQIEEATVILVRELDRWRYGVLLRVTTVALKRQILAARDIFKLRGYFVDLA